VSVAAAASCRAPWIQALLRCPLAGGRTRGGCLSATAGRDRGSPRFWAQGRFAGLGHGCDLAWGARSGVAWRPGGPAGQAGGIPAGIAGLARQPGGSGYQTGYRPQRTVVNSCGLRRTYRPVSGVRGERKRPVVN
jgi:hypothetical protein